MKVLLLEDVKTLGKAGEQVDVATGYARNYLVPRKMASAMNSANQAVFNNETKARAKSTQRAQISAEEISEKIKTVSLTIARMAGEEDKLFGSVTNGDIAVALKEQGIEIDKRKIELVQPLKSLGIHEVPVHLHTAVQTLVKVWVVKQGGSESGGEDEVAQDHRAPLMTDEDRAAVKEEKAKAKAKAKAEEGTSQD